METMIVKVERGFNLGDYYNSIRVSVERSVEYDPTQVDPLDVIQVTQHNIGKAIHEQVIADGFLPFIRMTKAQSNGQALPQVVELFEGTRVERD